jgi:tripartite motif-containing protein 71
VRRRLSWVGIVAVTATGLVAGVLTPAPTDVAASTQATFLRTLAGPSLAAMYPSGLVWDIHSNRLVVADTGLDRILVFQAPNWQTPFEQFGSFGRGNGQFDTPREVAVDSASNIYVADAGNSRVEAFTPTGGLRWATASGGKCAGCLNNPIGITYDAANNVLLVADTGHSVVKAFNPGSGTFVWASPTGMLASPREAMRGPDGRIWVADYHHQEVKAFNVTGAGVWNHTAAIVLGDGKPAGHLLGELNSPYNVQFSLDAKTVYVADTGNERIARWDISASPPAPLAPFGSRCPKVCPAPPDNAAYFQALRRVSVDTAGNIWGADLWGSGVHEFSPSGATEVEIAGGAAPAPGFAQAFGVAVGSNGIVYAVDRLNQRVERFAGGGAYLNSVGKRGVGPGTFSWPETVAVAPDGSVWVGDTRNDRLEHFSSDFSGVPAVIGGTQGSGLGQFNFVEGLTVDGSGTVWVADTDNNRIETYKPTTGHFAAFGIHGAGNGQFDHPQGIAVSASDVYVADTLNGRVEELTRTGAFVASFSTGLSQPQGIALAPDGTVWVADTLNNRIVHLSAGLTDLGDGFGSGGSGNTQFDEPHALAIHGSVLFVADTFNNRVQEFRI